MLATKTLGHRESQTKIELHICGTEFSRYAQFSEWAMAREIRT
jgi:hypothetical protein